MLRDVWIDEKPTGPSSLRVYMLVVRPPPRAKMAKAGHAHPNPLSTSRCPVSPEPIPPSPLRFCTQHPFIPQTGNFHTPSAHRHQNSRSACSPPPQIHPSAFPSTLWSADLPPKNWTLGVARDKPWAHHWTLGLVVSRVLHRTRPHNGNARLAGAQGRFGRFGGVSLGVVRQKGLAKACFFRGSRRRGGWRRGGIGARGWGACAMQRAPAGAGSDLDGMG